jgi:biotin carboxyl carrier protein
MQQAYRFRDQRFSVALQRAAGGRFVVTIGDESVEVEASLDDPATLRFVLDGRAHVARLARVGKDVQVALGGEIYVLSPDTGATADTAMLAAPEIVSPMPGKVTQVLVKEGDKVAAGDGLLILEAMKMENRLTAEAPAIVRKVHVESGQMVDGGTLLVELEYEKVSEPVSR